MATASASSVWPARAVGGLRLVPFEGAAIAAIVEPLASLRVSVFRAFPYLYDGSIAYEREYLASYVSAPGGFVAGAFDGEALVGAATGAPLAEQPSEWAAPLAEAGYPIDQVFYCGESVLLDAWRGRGIGHAFFDAREARARALGLRWSAFCSVIRPDDHPLRPTDYRPHDAFWRKRGYAPLDGVTARFDWTDIGDSAGTPKALQVWIRAL